MNPLVPAVIAAALLAALLALLWDRLSLRARRRSARQGSGGRNGGRYGDPAGGPAATGPTQVTPGSCLLCGATLAAGERLKSDINPQSGPGRDGRIMRIFGCPQCWPATPARRRTCPVCGSALSADDWAVARYFERPGRKHVHVLGCSQCRPRKV
ncbi:MAG TPA: hypothetical protein VMC79_00690 [Rectinemataceae bacterium]|nr:hypothetical protein [Rectinemataceae bacterium]